VDLNPITAMVPFEVTGKVPADIDVRLDNRYIDLRRIETNAVFQIQHEILRSFREKLLDLGFQEIRPPCIVAAATEGGTEVFRLQYFEKEAYLVQSPQLYKQLAVIGGMDRVFMTVPVFRAEKHNTTTHLNEVLQMDIEMGFADHNDAMDVLESVMLNIISNVKKNCSEPLKILGVELNVPEKIQRYTYDDCVGRLQNAGVAMEWGADFTKEQEKKLVELIPEELFFITEWPTQVRAFYSMPKEGRPEVCNAFDLMYRGLEIASGAQRIHKADMLAEALKSRGLKPEDFEFYIRAFRLGAPPHAGWSIGLERITMKLAGVGNIREACLFPRDRTRLTP
jgi:aspartyl-tRNA synthetase